MPRRNHFVHDGGLFRVIGDGVYVGAGEDEFRAYGRGAVHKLCEAMHDANGILQWVPSRDLYDERRIPGGGSPQAEDVGVTLYAAGRTVFLEERW